MILDENHLLHFTLFRNATNFWLQFLLSDTACNHLFTLKIVPLQLSLLCFVVSGRSLFGFSIHNFSGLLLSHCLDKRCFGSQQAAAFSENALLSISCPARICTFSNKLMNPLQYLAAQETCFLQEWRENSSSGMTSNE